MADVEEKCRDVGDRLRPGEAVHVRDAITRMATKDELVICQQYYDSMGEKMEGALERLWNLQREVNSAAPRNTVEHIVEVVGRKADRAELQAVASKAWCDDLAAILRGEIRSSAEELLHRTGVQGSSLERIQYENAELRRSVDKMEKECELMMRFINAFT